MRHQSINSTQRSSVPGSTDRIAHQVTASHDHHQFDDPRVSGPYYESRVLWPGSSTYHRCMNEQILSLLPQGHELAVLDNMCGTGVLLPMLTDSYGRYAGLDISRLALSYAQKLGSDLVQGDALSLPFGDESFHVVIVRGGLHHLDDMETAVKETARVLKPGGKCAFLEPREDNIIVHLMRRLLYHIKAAFDPEHEHGLTSGQLRQLVKNAGFEIVHEERYGLIGFLLFCNPDTVPFTRGFSFIPGAPWLARHLSRLDRWLNRRPFIRSFAFETLLIASKPAS